MREERWRGDDEEEGSGEESGLIINIHVSLFPDCGCYVNICHPEPW